MVGGGGWTHIEFLIPILFNCLIFKQKLTLKLNFSFNYEENSKEERNKTTTPSFTKIYVLRQTNTTT